MTSHHNNFLKKVSRTLAMHAMFEPEDSVLVGVSGGPDSTALIHALQDMSDELAITLSIAHFNHEIRRETADKEAGFVRSLAKKLNIPFYVKNENVLHFKKINHLSLEEAARELRYKFFFDLAKKKGFSKIALGHHWDDNAEQVLMNLMRGSGLTGLSGIPAKRQNIIVRPLIHSSRDEIEEFIRKRDIRYVSDASNQDKQYLRNRVRHHLLPILNDSYNPGIKQNLNRLAQIITDEEDWILRYVNAEFDKHAITGKDNSLFLNIAWIKCLPLALKRRILRHAIHVIKGDLRRIGFDHIDAALEIVSCAPGCKRMDLPDGVRVERISDLIKIFQHVKNKKGGRSVYKEPEAIPFNYNFFTSGFKAGEFVIHEIGAKITFSIAEPKFLPDVSVSSPGTALLDMDRIDFPITLRNILPGDRFTPLGMTGSQKIKKFFINNKIAKHNRLLCPVLLSKKKIIWLAGHRISEHVKVTPDTAKILKIELLLAK
jgi:tRNA(Ile)-lysidine synthase